MRVSVFSEEHRQPDLVKVSEPRFLQALTTVIYTHVLHRFYFKNRFLMNTNSGRTIRKHVKAELSTGVRQILPVTF